MEVVVVCHEPNLTLQQIEDEYGKEICLRVSAIVLRNKGVSLVDALEQALREHDQDA